MLSEPTRHRVCNIVLISIVLYHVFEYQRTYRRIAVKSFISINVLLFLRIKCIHQYLIIVIICSGHGIFKTYRSCVLNPTCISLFKSCKCECEIPVRIYINVIFTEFTRIVTVKSPTSVECSRRKRTDAPYDAPCLLSSAALFVFVNDYKFYFICRCRIDHVHRTKVGGDFRNACAGSAYAIAKIFCRHNNILRFIFY